MAILNGKEFKIQGIHQGELAKQLIDASPAQDGRRISFQVDSMEMFRMTLLHDLSLDARQFSHDLEKQLTAELRSRCLQVKTLRVSFANVPNTMNFLFTTE